MGYSTDFSGALEVMPPLNEHERGFLEDFADTRHTSTDHGLLETAGPSLRGNDPQGDKPEIWCHWIADGEGNLVWDESEKTYGHDQWLSWLIGNLLGPGSRDFVQTRLDQDPRLKHFTHDHVVSGEIDAQGEDPDDMWRIKVEKNNVRIQYGHLTYID